MPPDLRKLKDRANEAVEKGKHKKAAELFLELAKAEPAEPGWSHRAGEMLRKVERPGEAVVCLMAAAGGYARQGFLLKGVAVAKLVLSVEPGNAAAQDLLAALLAKLAKPQGGAPVGAPPALPSAPRALDLQPLADFAPPAVPPPPPLPVELGPDEPLASLALGRLMPDARPSREMPAVALVEIPLLEEDYIEIGALPQSPVVHPLDPGALELEEAAPEPPSLPPIPLFSSLSPDELRCLVQRVDVVEVANGELLFAEGDPGDALFVVVRGAVRVVSGAGRARVDLAHLTEGAFFGEVSLLSSLPRTATVIADGDGTLLRLSREVIGEVLTRYPEVLRVLLGFFRDRLVGGLLASAPLFAPFAPEERRGLVQLFKFVEIDAGATIIRQGELTPGLFVLLAGRLDVSITRDGGEVRLATLGAADVCGEMSLLTRGPAMATIRAATKCWALFVGRERFHEVMMTHPQVLAFISDLVEQRRQDNAATLAGTRRYDEGRVPVY